MPSRRVSELCHSRWRGSHCALDFADEEVGSPKEGGHLPYLIDLDCGFTQHSHLGLLLRLTEGAIVPMEFHKPST